MVPIQKETGENNVTLRIIYNCWPRVANTDSPSNILLWKRHNHESTATLNWRLPRNNFKLTGGAIKIGIFSCQNAPFLGTLWK